MSQKQYFWETYSLILHENCATCDWFFLVQQQYIGLVTCYTDCTKAEACPK